MDGCVGGGMIFVGIDKGMFDNPYGINRIPST